MSGLAAIRATLARLPGGGLRGTLTMLGIPVGVAAVTLLAALGVGRPPVSSVITIDPLQVRAAGGSQGVGGARTLSESDVQALSDSVQAPDIAAAVPITAVPGTLLFKGQNWQARTSGTNQAFPQVGRAQMAVGSFFSASDVENSAKVVVLGQAVVDGLFGGDPDAALGQTVEIQHQPFRVVGTLAPVTAGGRGGQDDVALIPITAGWNDLLGGRGEYVDQILVEPREPNAVSAAEAEAAQVLLTRHRIGDPSRADFQLRSPQDAVASWGPITGILTVLLGTIAAISLVLGVMGILDAAAPAVGVGPRPPDPGRGRSDRPVRWSIRSMVLAALEGLLGVGIGAGISSLVDLLVARSGSSFPAPVVATPSVLLGLGVSAGIGLFVGVFPAHRAAAPRSPIEALRYQ